MENLKLAIMSVVRSRGREVSEDDFVQFLSYTKNWIPPDYARRLFRTCVDANLLVKKGDKYVPNFEYKGVIPLDFRVTEDMVDKYSVREDVFTRILDKIQRETGLSRRDALLLINEVKNEARYVNMEVATLIFCKMKGVDCSEFYDEVERRLVV